MVSWPAQAFVALRRRWQNVFLLSQVFHPPNDLGEVFLITGRGFFRVRARGITPAFAPWLSSGFAFSFAAGETACPTPSNGIWTSAVGVVHTRRRPPR